MRRTLLLVGCLLLTAVVGCGEPAVPTKLLESVGTLKTTVAEILSALEAGDTQTVDAAMHSSSFKTAISALPGLAKQPGLPASVKTGIEEVHERIMGELKAIHKEVHGGGGIEALDVPAITTKLNEAIASIDGVLPEGWTVPALSADKDAGEDHDAGHDDHEGHDHDGHGHDHDHDHAEGDHDDGDHDADEPVTEKPAE